MPLKRRVSWPRMYRNFGSFSAANGANTTVSLQAGFGIDALNMATTGGVWTCPIAGWYRHTAGWSGTGGNAGTGYLNVYFYDTVVGIGAAGGASYILEKDAGTTQQYQGTVSFLQKFAVGDTLAINIGNTTGFAWVPSNLENNFWSCIFKDYS